MNKRAQTRLIGVTAIIIIGFGALWLGLGHGASDVAAYQTITQVAKGGAKVGDRVKIGGAVVAGSWNKQSNPMKFAIREEGDSAGSGPTLKVIYTGTAPNTFGDGVVAIVTGTLEAGNTIKASDMITKCPSKYQSAAGAIPVGEITKSQSLVGKSGTQTTGYVKPGSLSSNPDTRFVLAEKADGTGKSVTVKYAGALPNTVKDGAKVVLTGTLDSALSFEASTVALSQGQ